ncbi:arsenate reductase [Alphaproteobacteria bacterium KMM 3653]|uniref:Arsenate reductase n=1 Tax=Harenicola maris TaxID=2841044 RepID=A0AAP2G744_9RHOB|nr:arsenate reductase [Harenicola maris]
MKLYGLKTCDTCRKALKMLKEAGHEVTYVDVRADGISAQDIARFTAAFGDALLNTRSTTWRGLSEEERAAEPQSLIAAHPTLMKRPVIEGENGLTLGWTAKVQAQYL